MKKSVTYVKERDHLGREIKIAVRPPVRPNERDRSPEAEEKRRRHVTTDFTDGVAGIARSLVNYAHGKLFLKKPKQGSAAQTRRASFREYFAEDEDKLKRARSRHRWYRRQQSRGQ